MYSKMRKIDSIAVVMLIWLICLTIVCGAILVCIGNMHRSTRSKPIIEAVDTTPIIVESESVIKSAPEPAPVIELDDSYYQAVPYIAKTVYGEARGCSTTEQAAVIWCILNRVDSELNYMPDDIVGVITQKNQFLGYDPEHPVTLDIYNLTIDVLTRWVMEKNGEIDVGRVLPKDYLYFVGDGTSNHFRNEYKGGSTWDWSLESPYE